jgi:uncharacterized membrane protein
MRALRHLLALPGALSRAFPDQSLAAIEEAVRRSEQTHGGEIRVAVEAALDPVHLWRGKTARQRAIEVFAELGVWDTEHNNGVLLYLLLAERNVEIVVDRGYNKRVSADEWEAVCRSMESSLGEGRFSEAVLAGIDAIASIIARHFSPTARGRNELPDRPATL